MRNTVETHFIQDGFNLPNYLSVLDWLHVTVNYFFFYPTYVHVDSLKHKKKTLIED